VTANLPDALGLNVLTATSLVHDTRRLIVITCVGLPSGPRTRPLIVTSPSLLLISSTTIRRISLRSRERSAPTRAW
jgi:hypothetical protein